MLYMLQSSPSTRVERRPRGKLSRLPLAKIDPTLLVLVTPNSVQLPMANTKLPHSSYNVFSKRQNSISNSQVVQGVGQDKRAFASARRTSRQPAPDKKSLRAPQV